MLLRPSYVLSGAAKSVATIEAELRNFLDKATKVSPEHPVVVSKFYLDSQEVEVDAVADDGEIIAMAVSEHVENARSPFWRFDPRFSTSTNLLGNHA